MKMSSYTVIRSVSTYTKGTINERKIASLQIIIHQIKPKKSREKRGRNRRYYYYYYYERQQQRMVETTS